MITKAVATFTVYIRPTAKGRPRLGRGGRVFTPKKTHEAENVIATMARYEMKSAPPSKNPIILNIKAVFRIPKNVKKSIREQMIGSPYVSTPDKDNIEKLVSDSLNKICFEDDRQIFDGCTTKVYGETDCIMVEVIEWISK